jgi:hypothetical protein
MAGLIVAMGVVGLSREANNTFQEEARTSAAEAALRTAVDRLRSDLARAGYMSTGNILTDPAIAHAPGASNVAAINPNLAATINLAGIFMSSGGSLATNTLAQSHKQDPGPALNPDLIQIAGNMTTAEQFDVEFITQALTGSCQRIYLSPNSPALFRILGPGNVGTTELHNAFAPTGAAGTQFIVRLVDDTGRSQYLATCATGNVAGIDGTNQPYVDVDQNSVANAANGLPVLQANQTGTLGGVSGYAAGRAWVNPVQVVQWEITTNGATDPEPAGAVAALANQSMATGADPLKYDLMRSYVDATGALVPDTSEIVAEYAVDLSFAFTVDTGSAALPNVVSYAFDDAANNKACSDRPANLPVVSPGRIRSVRARVATRAALADRAANIPLAPANYGTQAFLYRYCVAASCTTSDGTMKWARTRTVTTEVALVNQARNYY